MRRHIADTVITVSLRHLDPAPMAELTEAEQKSADAAFARIVATPSDEPTLVEPVRPHRGWRRLLVTLGLAGAAGVTIPVLLFGGGSAYGSWTPEPEPLTAGAAARAADTCRDLLGVPDAGERLALAERRGEWTYVLLAGPGTEATCLMPDDLVGMKDAADHRGGGFFGRYDPDQPAPPPLDPDQIDESTSGDGSTDEGYLFAIEGYVGSDVTGVTVHTSSGLDIKASVVGDRFAAWWPGKQQSSHRPAETWSYTVQLADGRTRSVRSPTH